MSKNTKRSINEEARKLLTHHKTGLFSHILLYGTTENLDDLYIHLLRECKEERLSTSTIEFRAEDPSFRYEYQKSDVLIIKGLEVLPALHDGAFSLRSWLDVGQYSGLKSFIFCEESRVREHFNDYKAPFYMFCTRHLIG